MVSLNCAAYPKSVSCHHPTAQTNSCSASFLYTYAENPSLCQRQLNRLSFRASCLYTEKLLRSKYSDADMLKSRPRIIILYNDDIADLFFSIGENIVVSLRRSWSDLSLGQRASDHLAQLLESPFLLFWWLQRAAAAGISFAVLVVTYLFCDASR